MRKEIQEGGGELEEFNLRKHALESSVPDGRRSEVRGERRVRGHTTLL